MQKLENKEQGLKLDELFYWSQWKLLEIYKSSQNWKWIESIIVLDFFLSDQNNIHPDKKFHHFDEGLEANV